MKLLVLGGTRFAGAHTVESALQHGHDVTAFHRGRSDADLFPEVKHVIGDRSVDLTPLLDGTWDAMIDMCGYLPAVVRESAALLSDRVGFAVFVSSISAYASLIRPGCDEETPLATLTEEQQAAVSDIDRSSPGSSPRFGELYGAFKAACEGEVSAAFGNRCALARPGLIVGPRDYTGRFTYWVDRIKEGGKILAPGRPERPIQFIDARDLGDWFVRLAETETAGAFNVTGPSETLSMGELLETARTALKSDAEFVWVDEAFLLQEEVAPWQDLPLWLPENAGSEHHGMLQVSVRRAFAAGLRCRPLSQTVSETASWVATNPEVKPVGLSRERERALLDRWISKT